MTWNTTQRQAETICDLRYPWRQIGRKENPSALFGGVTSCRGHQGRVVDEPEQACLGPSSGYFNYSSTWLITCRPVFGALLAPLIPSPPGR